MTLAKKVQALGYANYNTYLRSAHWIAFKTRYRESGLPQTCSVCQSDRVHLHHHTYERLGSELLTDVTPLCEHHHNQVHAWLMQERLDVNRTEDAIFILRGGIEVDVSDLMAFRKRRKEKKTEPVQKNGKTTTKKAERKKKKREASIRREARVLSLSSIEEMPSCKQHAIESATKLWSLRSHCKKPSLRAKCVNVISASNLHGIQVLTQKIQAHLRIIVKPPVAQANTKQPHPVQNSRSTNKRRGKFFFERSKRSDNTLLNDHSDLSQAEREMRAIAAGFRVKRK